MAKSAKDNIVRLFREEEDRFPELPLDDLGAAAGESARKPSAAGVDLTGRPRVLMVFGPGSSGKSMLIRWTIERAQRRDDGEPLAMATMDVERPTLLRYFPDAMKPKPADTFDGYLQWLLTKLTERPVTTAIDFGADQNLLPMVSQVPELHQVLDQAGLGVVALYLVTPRQEDLTLLGKMEQAGFQPAATGIVCNLGRATSDRPEAAIREFAAVRRHSVYRAAIDRGAVEVLMPRHYAAQVIEVRSPLGLFQAADKDAQVSGRPMTAFDVSKSLSWLKAMEIEMAPISSWLP